MLRSLTYSEELKAIRQAARELGGEGYKPKITFVICAKRHNMRFFATADSDKDRTGNLPAGTVVDRSVTHPFAFDFFREFIRASRKRLYNDLPS